MVTIRKYSLGVNNLGSVISSGSQCSSVFLSSSEFSVAVSGLRSTPHQGRQGDGWPRASDLEACLSYLGRKTLSGNITLCHWRHSVPVPPSAVREDGKQNMPLTSLCIRESQRKKSIRKGVERAMQVDPGLVVFYITVSNNNNDNDNDRNNRVACNKFEKLLSQPECKQCTIRRLDIPVFIIGPCGHTYPSSEDATVKGT